MRYKRRRLVVCISRACELVAVRYCLLHSGTHDVDTCDLAVSVFVLRDLMVQAGQFRGKLNGWHGDRVISF
jgi:hypothetical protein